MSDISGAFWRLLVLQASWTYERLQGIGMGYASLPLLRALEGQPERHSQAVARATEYFNAHPYLAGIAVGAAARAERDGVAGATIQRLRTALSGPLGSLGDQLFWIGVVPAMVGVLLIAIAEGAHFWAVGVGLVIYLVIRILVTAWGVKLGLRSGIAVSAALQRSRLAEHVQRVGLLAGLAVGAAVPLVGGWFAAGGSRWAVGAVGVGAIGGVVAALVRFRVIPARRLTLVTMAIVWLLAWSIP